MTGKTHFTYALIAGVACCMQFDIDSSEVFVAGSLIGSLLPDIDHRGSTIGKLLPWASKKINKRFGHRKTFHYPVFYALALLCLLAVGMNEWLIAGLALGISSHLLLDRFNERGTPLLFLRRKKKNTTWGKVKEGGFAEFATSSLICIVTLYVIFCMEGPYRLTEYNVIASATNYFRHLIVYLT